MITVTPTAMITAWPTLSSDRLVRLDHGGLLVGGERHVVRRASWSSLPK